MTRTAFKVAPGVPLAKLLLDTNNPRIRAGSDQSDCIERLLRKPKQLLALARDIAANGLSTAPILVQPVRGGGYLVWDGNRRVTALKLLNDPTLCRNKALQAQFQGIAAAATVKIPTKLDVLASKDEDALLKEVLARHAGGMDGAGQLNWDPLLRTMFLLGHKAAPKDYRLAGLLLIWAEENGIQVDDEFPITTIHRFLNKKNLERLGFRDKQVAVEPTLPQDVAVRVVEILVTDFGSGKVGVNDVFTAEQQDTYIARLLREAGVVQQDGPASGSGTTGNSGNATSTDGRDGGRSGTGGKHAADDGEDDNSDGEAAKPRSGGRKRSPTKPDWDRKSIVRPRFKPDIPDDMWKPWEVLKELRRLETQNFPIAVAALFRVFFELSTKAYMKRHRISLTNEMHKNALTVATHMRAHGRLDEGELTAANRRFKDRSQAEALLQYGSLNDFMHSFKHMPDRQSLHALWFEVEPYLEACWDDTRRPR